MELKSVFHNITAALGVVVLLYLMERVCYFHGQMMSYTRVNLCSSEFCVYLVDCMDNAVWLECS